MYQKQKLIFLVAGALMSLVSSAAPASPGIITVTQPDGSEIEIVMNGDERFGFATTPDGIILHEDADGFLHPADEAYCSRVRAMRSMTRGGAVVRRSLNDGEVPTTGSLRGLVILAEYPDVPFSPANTRESFEALLNEEGYSVGGATGSVRDYYIDQSYGQFTPTFDVAGPVVLPNEMSYYGGDRNGATDPNAYRMIQDACRLADDEVDFSLYDNNGDGKADLVYVIYSGYAQSNGASTATVWPHMWFLTKFGVELTLDGVIIDRYACSSERMGTSGNVITGIGLFCHEFSHTLGLPDIYDTSYSSNEIAMGQWDVMDTGGYNNAMRTPAGYSSYEKSVLGWLTPETPVSPDNESVTLPSLGTTAKAFKMVSSVNPDEYFMLETRSKSDKWDAHLPGEGLVIVKVNYNAEIWDNNAVNSNGNHCVHLVPANGDFTSFTDGASTPFPGSGNVTDWTDLTNPSSRFSDGTYLGCAVTDIAYDGSETTFTLGKSIDAPVLNDPSDITETGFRANWSRVPDARFYTVAITAQSTGETKLYEKIVRNRFTFEDLDPEETYCYSVRSIGDILVSGPSEERTICLASQSGIAALPDSGATTVTAIYDTRGIDCGTDPSILSSGLYMIRHSDGTVTKVLIK